MIRSFADEPTQDLWNGINSGAARRIPRQLWGIIRRKLDQLDSASQLDHLHVPPGNRLHSLSGQRLGYYAIRINDQYRLVFRFEGGDAWEVQCTDYH